MNRVVSLIISLGLLYLFIVALYVLYRTARVIYISSLDTLDRDPHSTSLNRKYKVLNLMNKDQCKAIIDEAETHPWMKKRHMTYPTTDNEITESWDCYGALENRVKEVLFPALGQMYGLDPAGMDIYEIFVAKYDANGQRKLDAHRDSNELSFIMALNDSFTGGGTQFVETGEKVKLKPGQCMIFSGQNEHKGLEVTSGTRYIVAGFLDYRGEDYADKMDLYKFATLQPEGAPYISANSELGKYARKHYTYHEGTWHPVPSITLRHLQQEE